MKKLLITLNIYSFFQLYNSNEKYKIGGEDVDNDEEYANYSIRDESKDSKD